MKTRNMWSTVIAIVGLLTTSVVFGQSCDTLRNYIVPSNNTYTTWTSSGPGLILGQDQINDGTDNYNSDVWVEPYNIGTTNTQVRAIRMLPWKIQNNSGSAALTIQVYNDNSGEPGTVIGSQAVNYSDLNNTMVWSLVEFDNPVAVTGKFYVGYKVTFTSPVDSFALATTQSSTNYTLLHLSGPTGSFFNDTWLGLSDIYTAGGNPINSAFAFDVLLSTGTVPVPNFTGDNNAACLSGAFTGLDASSTTGDVDVYEWWLTDNPVTIIYDDQFGSTGTLNPTTASPSTQRIYLWTEGACVTRGVYSDVIVNPDVTATITEDDATCGNSNGVIAITNPSGGDGSYVYSIDGGVTTGPSSTFNNLAPDTYNVEVSTSGNGCSYSQSVTIGNTPAEVVTVGTNQTICAGDNATITASGNGTIEWFDGTTSLGTGTSISVSPTTFTTYTAVLTDANSCTDSKTVDVIVNPLDDAGFAYSSNSICLGGTNETPTINTPGGTFTVAQSGLSINSSTGVINMSTSSAGTYDITYTTNGTCNNSELVSITVNPLDDAGFAYSSNTICLGGGNETPTINTPGGTFTVAQSGLVINSSTGVIDMSTSSVGNYSITYTTNGTCINSEIQTVTITSSPDATFTYPNTEYCQNEGVVSPDFSGGGSAGTFSSTLGLTISSGNGNITLGTSTAGTYTITNSIAASGACPATSETFDITVKALPTVNAGQDQTVCQGTDVTLTATGDASTYSWDNGITQGTPFTPSLGTTTYEVTGTGSNNCTATDQVIVTVSATPTVNAGQDQTICAGEDVTLTASTSGGTISWDNNVVDGVVFNPTATDTYVVTANDNGCTATDNVTVTVNSLPTVNAGQNQMTCANYAAFGLSGTPTGGTFSGTGVTGNNFDPSVAGQGTFTITYTYSDGNGCENSATIDITVDGCADITENELNSVTITPNPSSDYIQVNVGESNSIETLQLVSLEGQIVAVEMTKVDSHTTKMNVSSIAKGTYFIRLTTEKSQVVKKIVVQ